MNKKLHYLRNKYGSKAILKISIKLTIKGGSRRAEKSRKVLMMMKAAKLEWAGSEAGQEQTMSRPGAGQEQCKSREEARVGQEH